MRTKLVVAMAARGVERARRPARRAGVERRRAEAILKLLMLAMNQLIEFGDKSGTTRTKWFSWKVLDR